MRFLPQANPLYQHVPTENIILPDILEKLGKGGFTGYLNQTAPNFEGYCIYAKGKLISALATEADKDKTGFEAIVRMFDCCINKKGEINVYRMTADLAVCANALTAGKKVHDAVDVRQVDIKEVLTRMKNNAINGVVKFHTPERYSMMFYRAGLPVGFYHDGAATIDTSPDQARRIASLPGARLTVYTTQPLEELLRYDLLQMVNLQKLWETARSRQPFQSSQPAAPPPVKAAVNEANLTEIIEDLKEVAMAYLSRAGGELVTTTLQKQGGPAILLENSTLSKFLKEVEQGALALDPDAKIDEMIDLMQSEVTGRLAV